MILFKLKEKCNEICEIIDKYIKEYSKPSLNSKASLCSHIFDKIYRLYVDVSTSYASVSDNESMLKEKEFIGGLKGLSDFLSQDNNEISRITFLSLSKIVEVNSKLKTICDNYKK